MKEKAKGKALYYSRTDFGLGERLGFAYGDIARIADLCLALRGYVCTPNALMLERARSDAAFARMLAQASLLVPDGIGACALLRTAGYRARRCAGVDLGIELARQAARRGEALFLYGGHAGVAARAALYLRGRFPALLIAGVRHGYGNPAEDAAAISASGAGVVFVCLGSPLQELFMAKHLPRSVLSVGLGGSLDVYAGILPRAPQAYRAVGAEWAYRMMLEPRRLRELPTLLSFYAHLPSLLVKQTVAPPAAPLKIGRN